MNGDQMKYLLWMLLLSAVMQAQNFTASSTSALPNAPGAVSQPFFTIENNVSLGILAGLVAADAVTTQRGLNEGFREVNPVMRPFVTREAAGSALGFGAAVGVAYLLHHTHHYKAERVTMRLMIAGEAGFVSNNIIQIR
jgi:hypothetical protein